MHPPINYAIWKNNKSVILCMLDTKTQLSLDLLAFTWHRTDRVSSWAFESDLCDLKNKTRKTSEPLDMMTSRPS